MEASLTDQASVEDIFVVNICFSLLISYKYVNNGLNEIGCSGNYRLVGGRQQPMTEQILIVQEFLEKQKESRKLNL